MISAGESPVRHCGWGKITEVEVPIKHIKTLRRYVSLIGAPLEQCRVMRAPGAWYNKACYFGPHFMTSAASKGYQAV